MRSSDFVGPTKTEPTVVIQDGSLALRLKGCEPRNWSLLEASGSRPGFPAAFGA
jgi:hypothetical protein